MIESGSVRKYLLYALGEIALVVFGILIALQINNWNEGRKESLTEQEYILRISNDLERDTSTLHEKLLLAYKEIDLYKNFVYKSYDKQQNVQEFATLVTSVTWTADNLILQDKTYMELTNTGNANLIKNLHLRDKITDYYKSYEIARTHILELNQTSISMGLKAEEIGPTVKYWGDLMGTIPLQPFMLQDSNWEFINDPSSEAFRLWGNAANYYAGKQSIKADYYTDLLSDAKELIELIKHNNKK